MGSPLGALLKLTPLAAKRYNAALRSLGIELSKTLTSIHVDQRGFSPEYAELQYDYLGTDNPFIIIVDPAQKDLPMIYEVYSFERTMLHDFFETAGDAIPDITSSSALCIEVEEGVDMFTSAAELLFLDGFHLKAFTPSGLLESTGYQRQLVANAESPEFWLNSGNRQLLVSEAQTHGWLLDRHTQVPEIELTAGSFYTAMCGGVFVLRDRYLDEPVVVVPDKDSVFNPSPLDATVLRLDAKGIWKKLVELDLITIDLDFVTEHDHIIPMLQETVAGTAILQQHNDCDLAGATDAIVKSWLLKTELPKVYSKLQKLQLAIGKEAWLDADELDKDVRRLLIRPSSHLDEETTLVVWRLLLHRSPELVVHTYHYDRAQFERLYAQWPPNKQKWVAQLIQKYNPEKGD